MSASGVKKLLLRHDAPRRPRGALEGDLNHQFVAGRLIQRDGYALLRAPDGHPTARKRAGRDILLIAEHRLIAEQQLGRFLTRDEVVDHKDGIRLHNHPSNLEVHATNAEHLRATLIGKVRLRRANSALLGTYHRMRAVGDFRLLQILRAAWSLGPDSPYLLGTHQHLRKAGIFDLERSTIEREWRRLHEKWELPLGR